jgi:hypothetical protein
METERASPRYSDIDVWDPSDILDAMIEGQFTAVAAVAPSARRLSAPPGPPKRGSNKAAA